MVKYKKYTFHVIGTYWYVQIVFYSSPL